MARRHADVHVAVRHTAQLDGDVCVSLLVGDEAERSADLACYATTDQPRLLCLVAFLTLLSVAKAALDIGVRVSPLFGPRADT